MENRSSLASFLKAILKDVEQGITFTDIAEELEEALDVARELAEEEE